MLRDKMLAVMEELNQTVAEREELIRMIALALLSGNSLNFCIMVCAAPYNHIGMCV